jgi:hypothetical protein
MSVDEILRLKQLTGLAALFKDYKFSKSWKPGQGWEFGQEWEPGQEKDM